MNEQFEQIECRVDLHHWEFGSDYCQCGAYFSDDAGEIWDQLESEDF